MFVEILFLTQNTNRNLYSQQPVCIGSMCMCCMSILLKNLPRLVVKYIWASKLQFMSKVWRNELEINANFNVCRRTCKSCYCGLFIIGFIYMRLRSFKRNGAIGRVIFRFVEFQSVMFSCVTHKNGKHKPLDAMLFLLLE